MRVAYVTSYRPDSPNGVLVAAAELAKHLATLGVEIDFWHLRRDTYEIRMREEVPGIRVAELPFSALLPRGMGTYARRMPKATAEWLRSQKVDGLHFHSIFQPDAWAVSKLTDTPHCVSPHGGYSMYLRRTLTNFAKAPLWCLFEQHLLGSAQFVHAVSDGESEAIQKLNTKVPVWVVPNGVPIPSAVPPVSDNAPWLFIGRLHVEKKGLDVLVNGYALASRHLELPRLIIRGPDFRGGDRRIRELVHRQEMDEKILLAGEVREPEKRQLLEACGLFIHPSRVEGLPLAPLEALASGRPVIVTPGTNLTEMVMRANAGITLQSCSAEMLAQALEEVATWSSERLALAGSRGRALVQQDFSWQKAAQEMMMLYDRYFDL